MELEDKETVESRVLMNHPLDGNSIGAIILSNCDGLCQDESVFEIKNGDSEENLGFDMGLEQNEEEMETRVSNVTGDLNNCVEGSLIEPADNMDIYINNLHVQTIFSELLSCICTENFPESGANKIDKKVLDTASDYKTGVKKERDSDNKDDLNIILIDDKNSGWATISENLMGLDDKIKDREDLFLVANSNWGNKGVGKECLAEDLAVVVDGEGKQTNKGAKRSEKLGNNVGLSIGYDDKSYNFEKFINFEYINTEGKALFGIQTLFTWTILSWFCLNPLTDISFPFLLLGLILLPVSIVSLFC